MSDRPVIKARIVFDSDHKLQVTESLRLVRDAIDSPDPVIELHDPGGHPVLVNRNAIRYIEDLEAQEAG